jgi:hypothetical protein
MTSDRRRISLAAILALAAFGNGPGTVACPTLPTGCGDRCRPPAERPPSERATQLRRMAWAACHARHLAAAYLLCDAVSDSVTAGHTGGQVTPVSPSTDAAPPPARASATPPQR